MQQSYSRLVTEVRKNSKLSCVLISTVCSVFLHKHVKKSVCNL